jgi:Tol biopolymer transport system component
VTLDSPDGGLIFGYGQNGYAFYLLNDGRLAFGKIGVNQIDAYEFYEFPALKITDTNFHHVAVTKAGNEVRFYLDGVRSRKFHYDTPFEFTTNAAIGARGDNFRNSFFGAIDELTIYASALSAEQILSIRDAGAGGKCKETRVQFEHASYPAGEASGEFSVRVTRTGDTSGASSVNYLTSNGTAQAGSDYTQTAGTLNFAAGELSKDLAVPVTNDTLAETDETLQMTLSSATGAVLGSPASATLTIHNTVPGAGRIMLLTGNIYSHGINAYNTDGSNGIQLTSLEYGTYATQPSVARQTGMIAFEGCGDYSAIAVCDRGRRIFVMNADGSNVRQVTTADGLGNPQYQADTRPVISPDGAKVAFLSARPGARHGREEIFVVGTDGTGLRQITTKQVIDQHNESYAHSVVWSPDSRKLLVHAIRRDRDDNGNLAFLPSIYTYNADGSGETLLARVHPHSLAIDWSPDGRRILYAVKGGPHHGVHGYVIMNPQDPSDYRYLTGGQLGGTDNGYYGSGLVGDAGSVRFSPDGQQIVYALGQDSSVRTVNLDGTNMRTVLTNYYFYAQEKWWWGAQPIPQPARLELTPNPAVAWNGDGGQLTPTLMDAQGGVIFRAAQWEPFFQHAPLTGRQCSESEFPKLPPGVTRCTGNINPRVNQIGKLTGSANNGEVNWCASNAGIIGCTRVQNFNSIPVSVRATTPEASKQTGAPGVFTISRPNGNATIVVSLALSGSARRDADYFLRASDNTSLTGNTLTMPQGETSVTLTVEPVGNSPRLGDRSVILGLLPDPSSTNAYTVNDRESIATVLLKEDRGLAAPTCTAPRVAPPAGMQAWLTGDGDTLDAYGGSDGTPQNGVTFAPGKVKQAFSFDGADDRVLLPTITLGTQYTVEAWVYPTRHAGYQHIISNDYRSPNFGALYLQNDRLNYWQGGTSRVTSSSAIPVNTWTHVALVYDGNLTRLYANGALVGTSAAHAGNFNSPVMLGYTVQPGDNHFAGRLDEVSFYSRALAAEELAGIHTAGDSGKCNPAVTPTPSPALGLAGMTPNRGSDKGSVTAIIRGQNIATNATVKLSRSGHADITGGFVSVSADKTSLQTIFNLRGKARGVWNVVVTNPGGATATLFGAFTIVEGKDTKVWAKLILHPQVLFGRKLKGSIVYGNSGDADAYGVPLGLIVRKDLHLKLNFNVMPMPTLPVARRTTTARFRSTSICRE